MSRLKRAGFVAGIIPVLVLSVLAWIWGGEDAEPDLLDRFARWLDE